MFDQVVVLNGWKGVRPRVWACGGLRGSGCVLGVDFGLWTK